MGKLSKKLARILQSDGMDACEAFHQASGKFQQASACCSVVAGLLTDISIDNSTMTDADKRSLVNSVLDQFSNKSISKEQMATRFKELAVSSGDLFLSKTGLTLG